MKKEIAQAATVPRRSESNSSTRAAVLKSAVALAMLAGMLLSRHLWSPDRTYPLAPVWDGLPKIPSWLGKLWFFALLGLLLAIAILPRPRLVLWAFVLLATLLALWDQSRCQPWFYQYLFLLFCLGFFPWREPANLPRGQAVLHSCRIVVAGTYLWSGLQKCNISFATEVFPLLIEPIVPAEMRDLANAGAFVVPAVETALGILLLVPRCRNPAVLLCFGMHAAILFGLIRSDWNTVVWPWNAAMMAFSLALFWNTPDLSFRALAWPRRSALHWLALLLFAIMPALSFSGYWDAYLSAALYSGNTIDGEISVSRTAYERFPPSIQKRFKAVASGRYELDLLDWSMDELNVPPYPAERVYRQIARKLAASTKDPTGLELILHGPPHWLTGERTTTIIRGDELLPDTVPDR